MDEKNAKIAIRSMIRCMAILDHSLLEVQRSLDDNEFKDHKLKVAEIMGELSEKLHELFRAHPHLEPSDADEWFAAGELDKPHWIKARD